MTGLLTCHLPHDRHDPAGVLPPPDALHGVEEGVDVGIGRFVLFSATPRTLRSRHLRWIPTQSNVHALEIPRRDLSAILANAARDHAEYLYHESVTALVRDGSGIEVTFERGIRAGSTSSSGLMGCIRECAG